MIDIRLLETGDAALDHEILAEKAASLGRAARRAELCVERLRAHAGDDGRRDELRKAAAQAVYAYFIQRELCGLRRHDDVIRELSIHARCWRGSARHNPTAATPIPAIR